MSSSYRVYCTWCGQTYISSSTQVCSLCGVAGRLIDPDSPEALADLKAKMQADPSAAWPKTRREWFRSIVHTFLVAPILTFYLLFTGTLFVGVIALLILGETGGDPAIRLFGAPCLLAVLAILGAKLIFLGYLFARVWSALITEDAEEKRLRDREDRS